MQGDLSPPSRLLSARDRELINDTFTMVGADDALPDGDVIVPLARFLAGVTAKGRLGVQLQPGDDVRKLDGKLDAVSLVALTFNKHVEGRPYSQARILREQLKFTGDVRAVGAVLRDMIFFMHRCGINQFLLRDVDEAPDAHKSLDSFTVRYQPATDRPASLRKTALYPLFLKLEGKNAVVVGGGAVAAHKADELARAGAVVRVISPAFDDAFASLDAELVRRKYQSGDTRGAFIVIAATGDPEVDRAVADEAAHGHALVNVVDDAAASAFYTGGVVRRGPLTISVGTSGASPALARKVRKLIDDLLPPGLDLLANALGDARPKLLERFPAFKERAKLLDEFVDRSIAKLSTATTRDDVAQWIREELK